MADIRRPVTLWITARQKLAVEWYCAKDNRSATDELRPLIMPRVEEIERIFLAAKLEAGSPG